MGGRQSDAMFGLASTDLAEHVATGLTGLAAQLDVLEHRQRVAQCHHLECATEAATAAFRRSQGRDFASVEEDSPSGWSDQAAARVECRGLARSVGTNEAGDASDWCIQRYPTHRLQTAEANDEVHDLQA